LELLLKSSPSLRIAYQLKEELITIYNSDITAFGGMWIGNIARIWIVNTVTGRIGIGIFGMEKVCRTDACQIAERTTQIYVIAGSEDAAALLSKSSNAFTVSLA
jgi:hypothetical protein